MERNIDITAEDAVLNPWVRRSMQLFRETAYLDAVAAVYPLQAAKPKRLEDSLKRRIIMAHQARQTAELVRLLKSIDKFPYDEPLWYLVKNTAGCEQLNPAQLQRIAEGLYAMTAEETVIRLEAAPKLNTQMGPMFNAWLRKSFSLLPLDFFRNAGQGVHILDASEIEAKAFIDDELGQGLKKRPDLVAKVNGTYIIGEAKWIGSPGGNQDKQVDEVLEFCARQRGQVLRIGIIDGFPWGLYDEKGRIMNFKTNVLVQESPYDMLSALLLNDFFGQYL